MTIDVASVDHALTTTRAVRRRLDLERPVDDEIIFDCIDVAEQAPTGGNQSSRRWVVVRDPDVKARLAELYRRSGGQWMIDSRDRLAGTGHPNEATMRSAAHLAEHLAEVPAIVIPTIIGRHDGSGRPGLFDSVLQSVWSFCVALRARGLGTAWTTAVLGADDELRELLGVPDGNTQIAMIPVAWTIGTDFGLAPREPARRITYVDRYGHTWERGPSWPRRFADGPGGSVELDVAAKPAEVWPIVTDPAFPVEGSEELTGARWADGSDGPALGARFVGSNQHRVIGEWDIACHVDRFEEERVFGWATVDPDHPGARWWFELFPVVGGTRVRYSFVLGPGPSGLTAAIERFPDREAEIIARRVDEHLGNMRRVLDRLAARLSR